MCGWCGVSCKKGSSDTYIVRLFMKLTWIICESISGLYSQVYPISGREFGLLERLVLV